MAAVIELENSRAINHKVFTSCNFGDTQSDCMEIGLGPAEFDCSGLVIAAISKLLNQPSSEWDPSMRHVRQMNSRSNEVDLSSIQSGQVLIFSRKYKFNGVSEDVPAHTGIVAELDKRSITVIHADDKAGLVKRATIERGIESRIIGLLSAEELMK